MQHFKITPIRLLLLEIMLFSILKSCALPSPARVEIPDKFEWQGHRGCRGLLPENTVAAFVRALEFPAVTTLELDVVITKDRQVLVSHEPFFNPEICLKPNGDTITQKESLALPFLDLTVAEIQKYDCGMRGHRRFPEQKAQKAIKPTLLEVVEAVRKAHPNRTVFWNIEIKSAPEGYGKFVPFPEGSVRLVLAEIRSLGLEKSATIQSFDLAVMQEIHRVGTSARLSFLSENRFSLDKNLTNLGFVPDIYSPYHLLVTRGLVDSCHKKNMKIIPWTVNDTARMRALINIGVDGIITDYPDRIVVSTKIQK